jgi:hypothetical protein
MLMSLRSKWAVGRVARSAHMHPDMGFTASPARTALKNSQLTCGDVSIICETVH